MVGMAFLYVLLSPRTFYVFIAVTALIRKFRSMRLAIAQLWKWKYEIINAAFNETPFCLVDSMDVKRLFQIVAVKKIYCTVFGYLSQKNNFIIVNIVSRANTMRVNSVTLTFATAILHNVLCCTFTNSIYPFAVSGANCGFWKIIIILILSNFLIMDL